MPWFFSFYSISSGQVSSSCLHDFLHFLMILSLLQRPLGFFRAQLQPRLMTLPRTLMNLLNLLSWQGHFPHVRGQLSLNFWHLFFLSNLTQSHPLLKVDWSSSSQVVSSWIWSSALILTTNTPLNQEFQTNSIDIFDCCDSFCFHFVNHSWISLNRQLASNL